MISKLLGFPVVVTREKKNYVCWCPDLDIADYGATIEESLKNLKNGIKLHLSCLPTSELNELKKRRSTNLLTTIEVPIPA